MDVWSLAGGIAGGFLLGLVTNLLSTPIYDWLAPRILRWRGRRRARRASGLFDPPPYHPTMTVGDRHIDWIVLQHSRFERTHLQFRFHSRPIPMASGFSRQQREFVRTHLKQLKAGVAGLPHNSDMYKVESFDAGSRVVRAGDELPVLRIRFRPTDYFTQLITDLNVGDPFRQACARKVDITVQPVPEFASILGVNLNLFTSDGYLVVTERSAHVHVGPGMLHTSVAENLLRPVDADRDGAPDPFRCATRGTREEIGVLLREDDVEMTTFGVQPLLCQYSLIGWATLRERSDELDRLRSLAVPKDKFENRRLHFVPATPERIAKFVREHEDRWFPIGLAAVVMSLFQFGYSEKEIHRAFRE